MSLQVKSRRVLQKLFIVCCCFILLTQIFSGLTFSQPETQLENNKDETLRFLEYTYTFEPPDAIKDCQGFDSITVPGLESYGNPGEPILPTKYVEFLLPPNTSVERYEVESRKKILLPDSYRVSPGQTPVPIDAADSYCFTPPNPDIYSSDSEYPGVLYKTMGTQYYRGYPICSLIL